MPRCDTEAMNLHLAEIAIQIAPGAHAALLVDGLPRPTRDGPFLLLPAFILPTGPNKGPAQAESSSNRHVF
jgi:hypothetical protein